MADLPPLRHSGEDGFGSQVSRWADVREHKGEGSHMPLPWGLHIDGFP